MCNQNIDTIKALRGMVFFADLGDDADNKGGTLMKKIRPCVICSVDKNYNEKNPRRYTVVPISSREEPVIFAETEVLFVSANGFSAAVADSMTAVSTYDIKGYIYTIPEHVMRKIDNAVKVHLGYEPASILEYDPSTLVDFKEYKHGDDLRDRRPVVEHKNTTPAVVVENAGETKVTPISSKRIISYPRLSQSDLYALKNKGYRNWTVEECVAFMNAFNDFSNGEIAKILGIKTASIYSYKSTITKKIASAGVSMMHSKVAES